MSKLDCYTTVLNKHRTEHGIETESKISSVRAQASNFQRNSEEDKNNIFRSNHDSANLTAFSKTARSYSPHKSGETLTRDQNASCSIGSERSILKSVSTSKAENISNRHCQKQDNYHGNGMAFQTNDELEYPDENGECSSTDGGDIDDDITHEIVAQKNTIVVSKPNVDIKINNNDRPKPGRLDLTQFDNITSAIAKLTVQPPKSVVAHKPPVAAVRASKIDTTSYSRIVDKSLANSKRVDSKSRENPSSADSQASPIANCRRPLQNPRKNHGRPVAPPRLPSELAVSSSAPSSSASYSNLANRQFNKSARKDVDKSVAGTYQMRHVGENVFTSDKDESFHKKNASNCSQSLIAHKFDRHSMDHKTRPLSPSAHHTPFPPSINDPTFSRAVPVSESENDPAQTTTRAMPRTLVQPLVGSYQRTYSAEPNELINTREETMRQLNEILAKPPPARSVGNMMSRAVVDEEMIQSPSTSDSRSASKNDKENKKDKKRDEKLEKRKIKEEERLRRQEEEKQRRLEKKLAAKRAKSTEDRVGDDGIPFFIKRCIEFIDAEGLYAEGIYRVPGNRAHVDAFMQKFNENPQMRILESDTPVNAVATALKDFLSKKVGPLIPPESMQELTTMSSISDKAHRASEIRHLVKKLDQSNYNILKYVFSHFVR